MSGSKYVWTTRIADGYRHVIPAQTSSYRLETTSRIGLGGPYEKKTSLGPQHISEGKVRKKTERERACESQAYFSSPKNGGRGLRRGRRVRTTSCPILGFIRSIVQGFRATYDLSDNPSFGLARAPQSSLCTCAINPPRTHQFQQPVVVLKKNFALSSTFFLDVPFRAMNRFFFEIPTKIVFTLALLHVHGHANYVTQVYDVNFQFNVSPKCPCPN